MNITSNINFDKISLIIEDNNLIGKYDFNDFGSNNSLILLTMYDINIKKQLINIMIVI